MTAKWKLFGALSVGAVVGLVAGCQTYDFQPVQPAAIASQTITSHLFGKAAKPNLMLVVDKSGSMRLPINASDPACPANCGVNWDNPAEWCPVGCKTRLSELQLAMRGASGTDGFLTSPASSTVGHLGLAAFPSASVLADAYCSAGTVVKDVVTTTPDEQPDVMQSEASQINQAIQNLGGSGLIVGGGTPTGASMAQLNNLTYLTQSGQADPPRRSFVILLTDGVPNCNSTLNPATCTCTGSDCTGAPDACLDQQATVNQIKALADKGIDTFVVGFGFKNQTSGAANATDVLNAMAEAGGQARVCDHCIAGEVCGADGKCPTKFYPAENAADLSAALASFSDIIGVDRCKQDLNPPPEKPEYLQVKKNGQIVASGPTTWIYDAASSSILLQTDLCNEVNNASASSPVVMDYAYVQPL